MLGNKIREARVSKGMTQARLAEKIGVRHGIISKYETGMVSPTIDQLQKIAEALGVSPVEFFDIPEKYKEAVAQTFDTARDEVRQQLIEEELASARWDIIWKAWGAADKAIIDSFSNVPDSIIRKYVLSAFGTLNRRGRIEAVFKMEGLARNPIFVEEEE